MSAANDGGPAFPLDTPRYYDDKRGGLYDQSSYKGMTLRDYFAAAALTHASTQIDDALTHPEKAAKWAYDMADAMLKEKTKP